MTSWGALLIAAFVVIGLSSLEERKAYQFAVGLVAFVIVAVGLGVL